MHARSSDASDVPPANKPIVETLVGAVARLEGVDPVDLSEPVFAFVDPDALDSLVTSAAAGTDLSLTFEAWGHDIVIDGDGTVRIDGEIRSRAPLESAAETGRGTHG